MEWKRAAREQKPVSLMIIDIDRFKNYNDMLGHQQGDITLQAVAQAIKKSVKRPSDFAARWGGEEFVVLLPATDIDGAIILAERLRAEIEALVIPCEDERGRKVTVSIGVSSYASSPDAPGKISEDLVQKADAALYKAKEAGRNRVAYS
jgi:diguanylate cyclase (GGDEF)-like protein